MTSNGLNLNMIHGIIMFNPPKNVFLLRMCRKIISTVAIISEGTCTISPHKIHLWFKFNKTFWLLNQLQNCQFIFLLGFKFISVGINKIVFQCKPTYCKDLFSIITMVKTNTYLKMSYRSQYKMH